MTPRIMLARREPALKIMCKGIGMLKFNAQLLVTLTKINYVVLNKFAGVHRFKKNIATSLNLTEKKMCTTQYILLVPVYVHAKNHISDHVRRIKLNLFSVQAVGLISLFMSTPLLIFSDVDLDPVGSAFIMVRGSVCGSGGIKLREKHSLTNRLFFCRTNRFLVFLQEIIFFKSETKKVPYLYG